MSLAGQPEPPAPRTGPFGPVVPAKKPVKPRDLGDFFPHPTKPGWEINGKGWLKGPDMAADAARRATERLPDDDQCYGYGGY